MIKKVPIIDIKVEDWDKWKKQKANKVWEEVEKKVRTAQMSSLLAKEACERRGYASTMGNPHVHTVRLREKLIKAGFRELAQLIARYNTTTQFLTAIYEYPLTPKYLKKMIFDGQQEYRYRMYSYQGMI